MVAADVDRYADSEFRRAGKPDEVATAGMLPDFERRQAAKRRYLEGKG